MATRSLGQLTIDIIAKIAGFEQGMDRAARHADKSFRRMEARAVAFGTVIGNIATKGITALGRGLSTFAQNTIKTEQALAQLDAILKSTGNAAGYSRDQLVSMAGELQKVSTFASTEIMEAQTRLLSYSGIVGENIPRAMQNVIDQSARLGMSLSQSAETIGRALESPAKAAAALAQQGFGAAFTDEVRATIDALVAAGREADAQILILEILEESYGGAARAARDTFGGALKALQNTLGDLTTGRNGSLDGATDAVNNLIDALNDPAVQQGFQGIVTGAMKAVEWLAKFAVTTGNVTKFLAEEVAARVHGAAADDIVRLEQEAERIKKQLSTAESFGGGGEAVANFMRSRLGLPTTEELRKRLGDVYTMIDNYKPPRPSTGVTPDFGQAQSVDLSGLDISGAMSSKAAKSARTEIDKLGMAYESLMASMHQRIELFGKEGEAARVRYEIEHGSLKGLSAALAEQAIARAEQIDSMERMARLQKAADKSAEDEARRIRDGLDAGKRLVSDLEFELELMGKTNAQRATAIMLRGMEKEAVDELGDSIAELNERIERDFDRMKFMDGMRNEFSNFITDVVSGTASITDAFKSMVDSITSMITRMIAERWVEQLFGQQGSTGTGSNGGWIASIFGSLFGGGRASGGWASPNHMYEVNERGLEMATVRGRDYLLTGGSPVEITPNHKLGGGGPVVGSMNFAFAAPASPKTQAQVAARTGYELRRAQRFGA